jgi:hypothetical protein
MRHAASVKEMRNAQIFWPVNRYGKGQLVELGFDGRSMVKLKMLSGLDLAGLGQAKSVSF